MKFPRVIQPEILDSLDSADPRAIRSRRDLRRVNIAMGHPRMFARALHGTVGGSQLVELGSGDGTLLLSIAKRLGKQRNRVQAVLVDRKPSVSAQTRAAFDDTGWCIDIRESDVFDWLRRPNPVRSDVTIANLFLHHFRDPELTELLRRASEQTRRFIACEPRRSRSAVAGAALLRLMACNDVTLHDARVSVRAGFRGRELSALWPHDRVWRVNERRSGPFTHMFVADHAV